jgi:hypothetical protein
MQLPELRMSFADRALLAVEIEQSLRCGRAFLSQPSPVPVLSDCVLVLVHPEHGGELRLPAQVVMANEHGTGLSLTTLTAEHMSELSGFADSAPPPSAPVAITTLPPSAAVDAECDAQHAPEEPSADADSDLLDPLADAVEGLDSLDCLDFPRSDEEDLEYGEEHSSRPIELQNESRQDRLRHLSPAEQLKVARRGELADRLAVERMYGKQVWEALLQNPRLTIPEVAKIARKGTVPKPLLDIIVDNSGWIKADAVRRALLTNPKVGADSVMKLLRITSKHELKLIEKGTAYGATVREAARKLLRGNNP